MSRKPLNLSTIEDRLLWVLSGAMCAKCKTQLILDDINKKINIGERAHIIGKANGIKGGPRREFAADFGITDENIDSLENLMLMCSPCHHTIDTNEKEYPPEDLFDMKKKHESWVTEQLSKKNKAIVVVHKRKNPMPIDSIMLSNETNCLLLDAVAFQEEFNNFTEEGWEVAEKENENFFNKVLKSKRENEGTYLYLFPLSPIPLLIHLGYLLSDTISVVVYQFDRNTQMWCHKEKNTSKIIETPKTTISDNVNKRLVVTIQVSGNIEENDVKGAVGDAYQHLDIKIDDPHLNSVLYQKEVDVIKQTFRNELYRLHNKNKYTEIHLFYYGPAGLAVEIGRCINQTMLPEIHLYEFNNRAQTKYQKAIII